MFYFHRAESLAGEIKDLQGQLADYNMVTILSTVVVTTNRTILSNKLPSEITKRIKIHTI